VKLDKLSGSFAAFCGAAAFLAGDAAIAFVSVLAKKN